MATLELSAPQHVFLNVLNTKFRAFVGGYGSGKTFVGCLDIINFFVKHPGTRQGYFGPSYPSIRDVFFPTFEEAAGLHGFRCDIKESNKEIHLYSGSQYYGTVICRSMDNPSSIIGFKIARALVDELDTLDPVKAERAWDKIVARMRLKIDGVENGIGVTTTPEGFRFVYSRFADSPTERYSMVQASTHENIQHLPDDYIDSLLETYPSNLVNAYVHGEFVNLASGQVYPHYDRVLNRSEEKIKENETLYVGMDFNVENMNAIVHVIRDGLPVAVEEITDVYDTPEMVEVLKYKYWQESSNKEYNKRNVIIYPDSSGDNRSTSNASETDITILEQSGFYCQFDKANPRIKDRVNAMNAMFLNAAGERRYKVNDMGCPKYAKDLEQQAWGLDGKPDKKSGNDHRPDSAGYYLAYEFPLIKPQTRSSYQWPI